MIRRTIPQFAVPPPGTYRDPSTRSAPLAHASIRRGTSFGSCEKSQSISSTSSAPSARARRNPARYAGPRPSLRSRWRTDTFGSSPARRSAISPVPSGELSSITSTETPSGTSERIIFSRFSRSLYVGRQTVAFGTKQEATYDRPRGGAARKRRNCGSVRPPGRPDGARRSGVLPRARLPARRDPDARDVRLDRATRTRRASEGAAGDRQDDRGEDRPDRRQGRDRCTCEKALRGPAGGGAVHAPAGSRAEDGCADLEGARRHDARRAEGGRRGRAAPDAAGARSKERGEDPEGARVPGGEPGCGAAAPRRRAAGRAGGRVRAPRASGRRARLGGGLGASAQGDLP